MRVELVMGASLGRRRIPAPQHTTRRSDVRAHVASEAATISTMLTDGASPVLAAGEDTGGSGGGGGVLGEQATANEAIHTKRSVIAASKPRSSARVAQKSVRPPHWPALRGHDAPLRFTSPSASAA